MSVKLSTRFVAGVVGMSTAALTFALTSVPVSAQGYLQIKLDANHIRQAQFQDPDLRNPWGMSFSPTGVFWVSDNDTNKTTLYNGEGVKQSLIVGIPGGSGKKSAPTGQVYNGSSTAFPVSQGGKSGAAAFIFVGEDGGITGWSPSVNGTEAIMAVDHSREKAVFKGCEIAQKNGAPVLLAANFYSGLIEEFDASWNLIAKLHPEGIPDGYAPHNVWETGGTIYVAYALQDEAHHDPVVGDGLGIVYTLNVDTGKFRLFASGGALDAPWGIAIAPSNFGTFSNDLLIANFGDGTISAYDPGSRHWLGYLTDSSGKTFEVDGIWGLLFGNGGAGGPTDWLYYTAGPHDENDGEFGYFVAGG